MTITALELLADLDAAQVAMETAIEKVVDIYVADAPAGAIREADEANRGFMLMEAREAMNAFVKEMSEAIAYVHFAELKKSRAT